MLEKMDCYYLSVYHVSAGDSFSFSTCNLRRLIKYHHMRPNMIGNIAYNAYIKNLILIGRYLTNSNLRLICMCIICFK